MISYILISYSLVWISLGDLYRSLWKINDGVHSFIKINLGWLRVWISGRVSTQHTQALNPQHRGFGGSSFEHSLCLMGLILCLLISALGFISFSLLILSFVSFSNSAQNKRRILISVVYCYKFLYTILDSDSPLTPHGLSGKLHERTGFRVHMKKGNFLRVSLKIRKGSIWEKKNLRFLFISENIGH